MGGPAPTFLPPGLRGVVLEGTGRARGGQSDAQLTPDRQGVIIWCQWVGVFGSPPNGLCSGGTLGGTLASPPPRSPPGWVSTCEIDPPPRVAACLSGTVFGVRVFGMSVLSWGCRPETCGPLQPTPLVTGRPRGWFLTTCDRAWMVGKTRLSLRLGIFQDLFFCLVGHLG